ncbi:hypothetical protein [Paractinoplanes rishiriensis]|uniref:hypothetical protein n=1 Tax=Paractinoplanes rishiriensis TaxID=1050105 RepID=UPI001EF370AF|nr:hypothetical protein [Actinoplanes rishiriensis]
MGVRGSSPLSSTNFTIAQTGGGFGGRGGGAAGDVDGVGVGDLEHGYHLPFLVDADLGDEGFDGAFAFVVGAVGDGLFEVGA